MVIILYTCIAVALVGLLVLMFVAIGYKQASQCAFYITSVNVTYEKPRVCGLGII